MQSIHLETSSASKVYTWKLAMHAKHTSGNQQCMQSIDLETSSACSIHLETSIACKVLIWKPAVHAVYTWKSAVHAKYTPGNQQCIQSIRLETSSACKVYAWKSAVQKRTAVQETAVRECHTADHYIPTLNWCVFSTTHAILFSDTSIEWSTKWVVYFEIKFWF